MKKSQVMVVVTMLLSLLFASCGPKPGAIETAPLAKTVTPAVTGKQAWEEDWERTLTEARKEGEIVVYGTLTPDWRIAFAEVMQKRFGITVNLLIGKGADLIPRFLAEQRNKVYVADVLQAIAPTTFFSVIQPLGPLNILQSLENMVILPEVVDPKVWWRGELLWFDPDTKTTLAYREGVTPSMLINTDLVKPDEIKSWKDLLNPKWKGKILIGDYRILGGSLDSMVMSLYGMEDWDLDFMKALLKQEPNVQRDTRLRVEWIARGKYPITVGAGKEEVREFKNAGAPIQFLSVLEGEKLDVAAGSLAQPVGGPHPNAAKVFINFFLSREGQTITSKMTGFPSSRGDVPTDFLDPAVVRKPGQKYLSTLDRGFLEKEAELKRKLTQLFDEYLKK